MHIAKSGIFRHLLSYVKQIPIESVKGEFNESLEVLLLEGKYMLNSPHATYSYEDRYTSYKTALWVIRPELKNIRSVLVLGLGLGSIPQMLQKIHEVSCIIDCVEYDNTVIQLAEKYYPPDCNFKNLQIHHADALDWMNKNSKKFDLITVDLFMDKNVPEKFHTENFILNLRSTLSETGVLLFSRLKENYKSEKKLQDNLQKVFIGGEDIDTGGNLIYCYKSTIA